MRRAWCWLAAALAAASVAAPAVALAQAFPAKPVRIIVPNAPGGATDILARLLASQLQPLWNQSVVVDYKPGANTIVGSEFVAKSAPDGYTLGMVVTSHVINPSLRANLPYDTLRDFAHVSMTAVAHVVIAASPTLEAGTLAELIALAKKQPGKLAYATAGAGSSMHLTGELLQSLAGIELLHVPFKGSAPAYPEVIAGRIALLIDPLFAVLPSVRAGKLKPLAVTSTKRETMAPEIPTVAETLPGFAVQSINGVVVAAGTPREVVRRLNADINKVLQTPELAKRMAEVGLTPAGGTPEEFESFVRAEMTRWGKVVKDAGIKSE